MRIAWLSNPTFGYSGYSIQTKMFVKKLQEDGHKVCVVANRAIDDGPAITVDGIYNFPGGYFRWPNDGFHWGWRGLEVVAERFKPEMCFTLFDIWSFDKGLGKRLEERNTPWVPIIPIDHDPIPGRTYERIKDLKFPVAMAPYGIEAMKKVGLDPKYLPHAVDTKLYRPYPTVPTMRQKMGGDDKNFIIGIVAANRARYDRKAFEQMLEAVGKMQARHKDVSCYFHGVADIHEGGYDLNSWAVVSGATIKVPELWQMIEGFSREQLVDIYCNMDVMLLTSRGEGFGIPLIEAQACGVPVITTNFAAAKDLAASNWLVNPKTKMITDLNSYQAVPDVDEIVKYLEIAYDLWKRGKLFEQKAKARKFAMQFDIDYVYAKYMVPLLDEIMKYKAEKANAQ